MNYVVYFVGWEVDFGENFSSHFCSFAGVVVDGALVLLCSGDVMQ